MYKAVINKVLDLLGLQRKYALEVDERHVKVRAHAIELEALSCVQQKKIAMQKREIRTLQRELTLLRTP